MIGSCRTVVGEFAGSELGSGVVGFPALPLADGLQEQDGSSGYVRVAGPSALPLEGAVVDGVAGPHPGTGEQLPNERGALGAVIGQALVRPLPRDEHAAA